MIRLFGVVVVVVGAESGGGGGGGGSRGEEERGGGGKSSRSEGYVAIVIGISAKMCCWRRLPSIEVDRGGGE